MAEPKYKLSEEKCRNINAYLDEHLGDAEKLAFFYQGWLMAGLALQVHATRCKDSKVDAPMATYEDFTRLEKIILAICQDLRI